MTIWEDVQVALETYLTPPAYQTFLSSASFVSYDNFVLQLKVPNTFSKTWMQEKCEPIFREYILSEKYPGTLVEYTIDIERPEEQQLSLFDAAPSVVSQDRLFNSRYTFDQFVVGHNNRFAHAACEAVAKTPASAYNPLFIYGSVGLGKTHLMHAIAHHIQKNHPGLKLSMVTSEKFTNDLINAIKNQRTRQFRDQYRAVDVLFVDDVQFLAGKVQTQEEFFHTFNDLYSQNKQIILTSDRSPKEIPTLEDRLRTRFEWGLIADIQPPELETRLAILRKKSEDMSLVITDEVVHFIATQIPSNVREMEGALNRIAAYMSLLDDADITLEIVSNIIKDLVGVRFTKPLSIQKIKSKVQNYFGVTDADLCSSSRAKDITFSRQIAMYLARELTNMSFPKIGEYFGKRDHTTVMYACDRIRTVIDSDDSVKQVVDLLISQLNETELN
jgi:chromosomal replication initiator protein